MRASFAVSEDGVHKRFVESPAAAPSGAQRGSPHCGKSWREGTKLSALPEGPGTGCGSSAHFPRCGAGESRVLSRGLKMAPRRRSFENPGEGKREKRTTFRVAVYVMAQCSSSEGRIRGIFDPPTLRENHVVAQEGWCSTGQLVCVMAAPGSDAKDQCDLQLVMAGRLPVWSKCRTSIKPALTK